MKKTLLRDFLLVTSALACLGGNTAYAESRYGPGVTDKEVKIGQTMPYSGPVSLNSPTGKTMLAFFQKINDEGGINGRKIRLISLDDGYSPPKTVEHTRRLVEGEDVLLIFGSLGTPTNLATQKYLNAKRVPQIFITTGVTKFGDPENYPWTMGFIANFETEAAAYADYILNNRPTAKIGVLYQNDDYGRDLLDGLKKSLGDKAETMIVAAVTYEVTDPTVSQQIITLKQSGADVFMNFSTPKAGAQAIRKAYDIGWRPLQFVARPANAISSTLKVAGLDKSVGVLSATSEKDPTDPQWRNDPAVNEYLNLMRTYYPDGDASDPNAVLGYNAAMAMATVIQRCGDDLTRENIMQQATSLNEIALPMLLPGITLNTSSKDYFPIEQVHLQRFNGSRWLRVD
jgi:ABC-type branched-subunit amino acid transport system substrate-binding protein